jgi:hypothetical protein
MIESWVNKITRYRLMREDYRKSMGWSMIHFSPAKGWTNAIFCVVSLTSQVKFLRSKTILKFWFSLTVSQTYKIKLNTFGWHLWHQYQITWQLICNTAQSYTEWPFAQKSFQVWHIPIRNDQNSRSSQGSLSTSCSLFCNIYLCTPVSQLQSSFIDWWLHPPLQ